MHPTAYNDGRRATHVAANQREGRDMPFINTLKLAERWQCSTRKIEQQRQSGDGPAYVKIGSQVLYDLNVVQAYEAENTFGSTAERDERSASSSDSAMASLSTETTKQE
jgi:hypothetical protein